MSVFGNPRSRSTRILAALAVPALSLSVMAGAASAAGTRDYYVGQNTPDAAIVTPTTGLAHTLRSQLRAVSADGTINALSAQVTPSRAATVLVDVTTGIGRIVGVDSAVSGTLLFAGDDTVVTRKGNAFSLVDPATGQSTTLAGIPAATDGSTRTVTAVNAISGGALVATADVTPAGTSGQVRSAAVWRLTADRAEQVISRSKEYVVAVAAHRNGIDAVLVSLDGDAVSLLVERAGSTSVTPTGLTITPDVDYVDLGYARTGDDLAPVVSVVRDAVTTLYEADGGRLAEYGNGARVFVSASDINDPTIVSNRLFTDVTLSGIRNGDVVRYGSKVTPEAAAVATSDEVAASAVPATLTLTTGKRTSKVTSGKRITVNRNTCFTASADASLYTRAAQPETKCIEVAHRLVLDSFNQRKRVAAVKTSADQLLVQVQKGRGRWETSRRVNVDDGRAAFSVPRGKVRVVAVENARNTVSTLMITDD